MVERRHKLTKRYTVISVPTRDGPTYRIYDRINQCSIDGGFDTQRWAESAAEMMEEKWRHDTKRENGTKRRKSHADKKQDNRDY